MSERNLFKLLDFDSCVTHRDELVDFDPWDDDADRKRVDAYAIIKEAQQNPQDVDLLYTFRQNEQYKRCCPLHQAILLGLDVGVIYILSSPVAVKQKCDGATALHLALYATNGEYFDANMNENVLKDVVALLLR
eukprot:6158110-Ditylum_brightwellii.AAC.1